mgnify:CR=1 FL=1
MSIGDGAFAITLYKFGGEISRQVAIGITIILLGNYAMSEIPQDIIFKARRNDCQFFGGKAIEQFEQENERRPSIAELAIILDQSEEKVAVTLKSFSKHVSIDAPFVDGEDNSLLDVLVNEDAPSTDRSLMRDSLNTEIDRVLSTLSEREAEIIKLFFGIGPNPEMTLEEIGDKFGLTRERVRQIKEKAIRKLRAGNKCDQLKSFLC